MILRNLVSTDKETVSYLQILFKCNEKPPSASPDYQAYGKGKHISITKCLQTFE